MSVFAERRGVFFQMVEAPGVEPGSGGGPLELLRGSRCFVSPDGQPSGRPADGLSGTSSRSAAGRRAALPACFMAPSPEPQAGSWVDVAAQSGSECVRVVVRVSGFPTFLTRRRGPRTPLQLPTPPSKPHRPQRGLVRPVGRHESLVVCRDVMESPNLTEPPLRRNLIFRVTRRLIRRRLV